jgi:hypothetical protein
MSAIGRVGERRCIASLVRKGLEMHDLDRSTLMRSRSTSTAGSLSGVPTAHERSRIYEVDHHAGMETPVLE